MGEKTEKKIKDKSEKKVKDKSEKKEKSKDKSEKKSKSKSEKKSAEAPASAFSLLADTTTVDPTLSSLFAAKPDPPKPRKVELPTPSNGDISEAEVDDEDEDGEEEVGEDQMTESVQDLVLQEIKGDSEEQPRKRKRKNAEEELEDAYMAKLAREEDKEQAKAEAERAAKRQKPATAEGNEEAEKDDDVEMSDAEDKSDDGFEDVSSPPPQHETVQAANDELSKANRTVFLGNVSTSAIMSKTSHKTLTNHLTSFFDKITAAKGKDAKHKLESIRFRSTPYDTSKPKKAAFAKKELMDATTKSTNAYAVYSSPLLARQSVIHLNGSMVLDRHLRVDEIAHPAKVDNRRCVFVGNLGFVDDESNIQDANEADGREVRKRGKVPSDIEEGLWRTFGKCGNVESVRVIRDSTTRVGKGIAYVQFEDENAVEAALLYDEKKFPPMLPRKLRVSRAKALKRNPKPGSDNPTARKSNATGYQRKLTGKEASNMGRTGQLYGRAAAAKQAKDNKPNREPRERKESSGEKAAGENIRKPEDFIFEGHRASSRGGKAGLKLGGKGGGKKKASAGKPTNRSAKRGAAFKATGKAKK